ncbi:DHH family phosphoesterase [Alkalithermobacter thermoalcaliphilus]
MSQINDVIDVIRRSDNIVITSHYSPDGDSIGSSVALYHMFKNICKNVYIVLDDKIPMNLQFLCNNISINKSEDLNIEDYTLVCVDCGDFSRLSCSDQIKQNSKIIVNIDHHASNNKFGNVNYIDENASSTCELVYNLVYKLDKKLLDKDIAQCLYTGLITDTGNFMYSNTHSSSFKMAADLLSLNIDKQRIIENIYQSNPLNLIKLIGEAIGTIEVINKTVACIEVTRELMDKYEIDFNDVDGIVNYARDINGVELAILFKEKSDSEIKISFRSKSYIDVNRIASKFKGGGHKRASGCTMNMSLKDAKSKIISEVLKHI